MWTKLPLIPLSTIQTDIFIFVFSFCGLIYFKKLSRQYTFIGKSVDIAGISKVFLKNREKWIMWFVHPQSNFQAQCANPTVKRLCPEARLTGHLGWLPLPQVPDLARSGNLGSFYIGEVFWHHGGLRATEPDSYLQFPPAWPPTQFFFWSKEHDSPSGESSSHSQFFLHPPRAMDHILIHTHLKG